MPPRDVWDCNAIFEPTFYAAYSEFIYRHRAIFGFFPSDLIQDSEWSDDSDDEDSDEGSDDSESSGFEHESIGSVDESESESGSDMSIDSHDRDEMMALHHLIVGDGSEDEPFDLTAEE